MAHTNGLVVSTKEDGWAQVITQRKDACGGCGSAHNCHSCLANSKIEAQVLNRAGAGVGDLVTVSLSSRAILKSAAVAYLIPVAGLMAGAIIGAGASTKLLISETSLAIAFGFAGLCLGFILVTLISRWMSAKYRLVPVISHIIKPGSKPKPSSVAVETHCKTLVYPG